MRANWLRICGPTPKNICDCPTRSITASSINRDDIMPRRLISSASLFETAGGYSGAVVDTKGGVSQITIADVLQSNGVIHVVDTVLLPMYLHRWNASAGRTRNLQPADRRCNMTRQRAATRDDSNAENLLG
jgi:hypothetical protein